MVSFELFVSGTLMRGLALHGISPSATSATGALTGRRAGTAAGNASTEPCTRTVESGP